jgi:hypothetical protein
MSESKTKMHVLYSSMNRCLGPIEEESRDEPIEEYTLTSEQDAALFRKGMEDAAGWMWICSFRTRGETVQHVEECLARAANGNQPRNRPWAGQGSATAAVRTVTCQQGTRTTGQHEVHVVDGKDNIVKNEVEEFGVDAAVHS